ncbi:DUF4188 domain-containing protein [Paenibacillus sp. XY044]|uniref:DUF4188 domain-containing protein n=1 Tax=Paenibacillus sp. XY044 TaxID=2026089 RepID=UPI000B98B366|nr:DUF4188 domain-containing protein [Paenibacillus sp. XY044]OZB96038.1 transcriptional regulator [Paenibacillus sp. XY044]
MGNVIPGRYTAEMEGSFVVFIIGMRVNRLWSIHKWLPVFRAMPAMMKELYQNRDLGFMDGTMHISWRGVCLIQYWRSYEQLEDYARRGYKHLTAWRDFNRRIGTDGTVGIYHETFLVEQGASEALYNNMPLFGLARAGRHVPATGTKETAGRRLGRDTYPAVPSPPNPS